jgi:hypothetical protein
MGEPLLMSAKQFVVEFLPTGVEAAQVLRHSLSTFEAIGPEPGSWFAMIAITRRPRCWICLKKNAAPTSLGSQPTAALNNGTPGRGCCGAPSAVKERKATAVSPGHLSSGQLVEIPQDHHPRRCHSMGCDVRFVVTNLPGTAKILDEKSLLRARVNGEHD